MTMAIFFKSEVAVKIGAVLTIFLLGTEPTKSQNIASVSPSVIRGLGLGEACGQGPGEQCDRMKLLECSDLQNGTCICIQRFYSDNQTIPNCHSVKNLMVPSVNFTVTRSHVTLDIEQPSTSVYIAFYQVQWVLNGTGHEPRSQNVDTAVDTNTVQTTVVPAQPGLYAFRILSVETASRPQPQYAITDPYVLPFGNVLSFSSTISPTATTTSPSATTRIVTPGSTTTPGATTTPGGSTSTPGSTVTPTITTYSPRTTSTTYTSLSSTTQSNVANPGIVTEINGVCGEDFEKICDNSRFLECSDQLEGVCICKNGYYNDHLPRPSCNTVVNLMVTDLNVTVNMSYIQVSFRQPSTASHIDFYQLWWSRVDEINMIQKSTIPKETSAIITSNMTVGLRPGRYTVQVVSAETRSRPNIQFVQSAPLNVTVEGRPTMGEIWPNNTVVLDEGDALHLVCTSDGLPPPTIRWYHHDSLNTTVNGSYTKDNVTRRDAGRYICIATNKYGSLTEIVDVFVRYAPIDVTNEYDRTMRVKAGASIILRCLVDSYPAATYTWLDDIEVLGNAQTLNFTVTDRHDASQIYCNASNELGIVTIPYSIFVIPTDTCGCLNNGSCVPIPTGMGDFVCVCQVGFTGRLCETDGRINFILSEISPTGAPSEGSMVTLTSVNQVGDVENVHLSWLRRGEVISNNSRRFDIDLDVNVTTGIITSSLTITDVKIRDTGTWYLMISNWYNTTVVPFSITVIPLPSLSIYPYSVSIKTGSSFTLRCDITNLIQIDGEIPRLEWYKNGERVSDSFTVWVRNPGVSVLERRNAQVEDNGRYQCCTQTTDVVCSPTSFVQVSLPQTVFCPDEKDQYGINWTSSAVGSTQIKQCPMGFVGTSSRRCGQGGNWESILLLNCVREDVADIQQEIDIIITDAVTNTTAINNVIDTGLEVIGGLTDAGNNMTSGDLSTAVNVMTNIASISKGSRINETKFVTVIDRILDSRNTEQWEEVRLEGDDKASDVFQAMDTLGSSVAQTLSTGEVRSIKGQNIEMDISKAEGSKNISFPRRLTEKATNLILPSQYGFSAKDISYTAVLYKTISNYLPSRGVTQNKTTYSIRSQVLSLSIGTSPLQLDPPVSIGFQHLKEANPSLNEYVCSYWNFSAGGWSSEGCVTQRSTSGFTQCECDHLTNFAVLMRPYEKTEPDTLLGIISIVGCSISIVCIALTIAIFIVLWRYIKTDHIVILVNICVSLGLAYLVFVLGVDKTENDAICTVVTVLLQYLFLAVFFLMLAEGIHYFLSVTLVYYYLHLANDLKARNSLKWLLLQGWGIPAVITAITVGITYNNGYHSKNFCWLSVENGVLYAFVGPALLVILINVVIICTLFRVMYATTLMSNSNTQRKAYAGLRSMCTLLPILGITWVFGILAINDSVVAVQYIFAITNSLQGLFIFVFHCLLNKKVQEGVKQRMKLYESQSEASRISSARKIHQIKMGKGKEKKQKQPVILLSFNRSSEYQEYYDNVSYSNDSGWTTESLCALEERRDSNISNKTGSYTLSSSTDKLNGHLD